MLGQIALAGGLLAFLGLAGCATTPKNSRVGQAIPDGPRRRPAAPLPRQTQPIPGGSTDFSLPTGIIARSAWTSAPPDTRSANPMRTISRITLHHEGASPFTATDNASVAARLEAIRKGHRRRGWADIGYHYVIDPSGRVWEGRDLRLQGAHVAQQNENNLGIMVLGNFEQQRPTNAATNRLDALVTECMRRHRVSVRNIYTHRELAATSCPGRYLQSHLVASRAGSGAIANA
jgi:hypothetical protein